MATSSSDVVDVDNVSYSRSDEEYVEELMDAMTDMSQAEDNVGMLATWSKILVNKADKVRPMCVEMLGLLKRAQHEQLGDKKSANSYPNFEHRFREACDAARTQKTIGKHLMEAPYSWIVANDPTYAASVGHVPRNRLTCLLNEYRGSVITVASTARNEQPLPWVAEPWALPRVKARDISFKNWTEALRTISKTAWVTW